jgi:DNA-binding protein YbaB
MYKIQSRTIFGWMDVIGDFDTIQEAQEKIPKIQEELSKANSEYYSVLSILRITDKGEMAINDNYVYEKDEFF